MAEAKTVYRSQSGREFPSAEEADRHDQLLDRHETFTSARAAYAKALSETNRTADGQLFNLNALATYYYVVAPMGWNKPALREVSFYIWKCDIDENDRGVLNYKTEDGAWVQYRIADLYRSRKAALIKLKEETEEYIRWMQEDLTKLEDQISNSR